VFVVYPGNRPNVYDVGATLGDFNNNNIIYVRILLDYSIFITTLVKPHRKPRFILACAFKFADDLFCFIININFWLSTYFAHIRKDENKQTGGHKNKPVESYYNNHNNNIILYCIYKISSTEILNKLFY